MSDIMDLFGDDPQAVRMQAEALANAMRRRRAAGTVASIIGGPLAQAGKAFLGDAEQTQGQLGQAGQFQGTQKRLVSQAQAAAAQRQAEMDATSAYRGEQLGLQRDALGLRRQEMSLGHDAKEAKDSASGLASADALRKEFQGQDAYKQYRTVEAAYKKILSTSETGPGDMSLIFGYMKLLDPGSTVREGEYATAAQSGSLPQNIIAAYNKTVQGEKLAPAVRKQFRDEASKVFGAQRSQFDQVAGPYVELAKKRGLDPADVIFGYTSPAEGATTTPAPSLSAQRAQGKDGKWYRLTPAGWEPE